MNSTNKIINYINDLEEVKRLKELEPFIKNNKLLNELINERSIIQKKIVNSKECNQFNQAKEYELELKEINDKINDIPFVEEYMELNEYVSNLLLDIKYNIEEKLEELMKK